jgi:hypothetical protein
VLLLENFASDIHGIKSSIDRLDEDLSFGWFGFLKVVYYDSWSSNFFDNYALHCALVYKNVYEHEYENEADGRNLLR